MRHLFAASRVRRYHTCDIQEQSLAQHSWGVAMIISTVVPDDYVRKLKLLQYALTHDLHEVVSGDSPATAKWSSPELEAYHRQQEVEFNALNSLVDLTELTPWEKEIFKWADVLELVMWCEKEMAKGNKLAKPVYERGRTWLGYHNPPTEFARLMYEELFR